MPRRQTATIYDVAAKAGVSISTVSRVLNTPHRVSEKTRREVLAVIDELAFVPKADATARARKEVGRIGVLTPFFTNPSFVQRMRGVAAALADSAYELVIYPVDSRQRLDGYLAMLPASRRLDGLIMISMPVDGVAAERLINNGLETVLIESTHPFFSSVEIDDRSGGTLAAQYFLGKGHRRCAYVGDRDYLDYGVRPEDRRLDGYQRTLEQFGVSLPKDYVQLVPLSRAGASEAITNLLALPEPPTAIFAATDDLAMVVLKILRQMGIDVPAGVAIIGFDDLDVAEYLGLTTVSQHLDESGRTAAELLLARVADPSRPVQRVRLPLSLVERETA